MTTYYVHEEIDKKNNDCKFLFQTTSKKKAMKACEDSATPVRVTKFVKWNSVTPVVYYNQAWEDKYLNTVQWAKGAITLGEW